MPASFTQNRPLVRTQPASGSGTGPCRSPTAMNEIGARSSVPFGFGFFTGFPFDVAGGFLAGGFFRGGGATFFFTMSGLHKADRRAGDALLLQLGDDVAADREALPHARLLALDDLALLERAVRLDRQPAPPVRRHQAVGAVAQLDELRGLIDAGLAAAELEGVVVVVVGVGRGVERLAATVAPVEKVRLGELDRGGLHARYLLRADPSKAMLLCQDPPTPRGGWSTPRPLRGSPGASQCARAGPASRTASTAAAGCPTAGSGAACSPSSR